MKKSMNTKGAVVLLSGGLDSTTVAAIAQHQGFTLHALSFRYGQRHATEIAAAKRVAKKLGIRDHKIATIDLRLFGGSALTADIPVPKHRTGKQIGHGVPITYVPARNTIFLSVALGWAEATGARDIYIGINALDYSGYPDCRAEFIEAFAAMAALATKAGVEGAPVRINTPLQFMTKADIAKEAARLGLDAGLSWSCYDPTPDGKHCGQCDSCRLRAKGFAEAELPDPTVYA